MKFEVDVKEVWDRKGIIHLPEAESSLETLTRLLQLTRNGLVLAMRNEPGKPAMRGRLFYLDPETDERRLLGSFEYADVTRAEATKKALDELWDARLDSAGCTPVFWFDYDPPTNPEENNG